MAALGRDNAIPDIVLAVFTKTEINLARTLGQHCANSISKKKGGAAAGNRSTAQTCILWEDK